MKNGSSLGGSSLAGSALVFAGFPRSRKPRDLGTRFGLCRASRLTTCARSGRPAVRACGADSSPCAPSGRHRSRGRSRQDAAVRAGSESSVQSRRSGRARRHWPRRCRRRWRCRRPSFGCRRRERQHVGRLVLVAEAAIKLAQFGAGGDADADFAVQRQRARRACAANRLKARRALPDCRCSRMITFVSWKKWEGVHALPHHAIKLSTPRCDSGGGASAEDAGTSASADSPRAAGGNSRGSLRTGAKPLPFFSSSEATVARYGPCKSS